MSPQRHPFPYDPKVSRSCGTRLPTVPPRPTALLWHASPDRATAFDRRSPFRRSLTPSFSKIPRLQFGSHGDLGIRTQQPSITCRTRWPNRLSVLVSQTTRRRPLAKFCYGSVYWRRRTIRQGVIEAHRSRETCGPAECHGRETRATTISRSWESCEVVWGHPPQEVVWGHPPQRYGNTSFHCAWHPGSPL
jgi:hypothetical protein